MAKEETESENIYSWAERQTARIRYQHQDSRKRRRRKRERGRDESTERAPRTGAPAAGGFREGRADPVTWAKLHNLGGYKSGYYRAMR